MWFKLLIIFQLQLLLQLSKLFFIYSYSYSYRYFSVTVTVIIIFQLVYTVTVLRTETEHQSIVFALPVKQQWPTAQISTIWQSLSLSKSVLNSLVWTVSTVVCSAS